MLERARDFNADIIMCDLEDSVPPAEKVNARNLAREWVPQLAKADGQAGRKIMVRCNALDTGLIRDELKAVLTQITAYCGVPAGVECFRIARKVLAEIDAAK